MLCFKQTPSQWRPLLLLPRFHVNYNFPFFFFVLLNKDITLPKAIYLVLPILYFVETKL